MDKKGPIELYLDRMRPMERRRLVRPMKSGEVIEAATRLYQLKAAALLGKTLASTVPCYFALVFFFSYSMPALFTNEVGASIDSQAASLGTVVAVTLLVAVPVFVAGFTQALATTILTVAPVVTGDEDEPRKEATGKSLVRLAWTLVYSFAIGLLPLWVAALMFVVGNVTAGFLDMDMVTLFAVIGFFLLTISVLVCPLVLYRMVLAPVICIIESLGPVQSIKRGSSLLKTFPGVPSLFESYFVSLVVIAVVGPLMYLGVYLAMQIIGAAEFGSRIAGSSPWSNVIDKAVEALPGFVVLWFVLPFWGCTATLMYFDRRARMEALDIRLLAQDLKVIDHA